jgi:hypothetical protein
MEKNTLQQKIEIAKAGFPVGCKVCNVKLGSVGIVSGEPFTEDPPSKVFVPVSYNGVMHQEDAEYIVKISSVTKGVKRHS